MLNKIYHGDCLEVMRQWPPECVDMCVTSPPYWGLRDYGIEGQLGLEKTPEEYISKLVEIFCEVRRVLKPWGTVWLNMGDSYAGSGKGAANYPGDYPKQNSNRGSLSVTRKSFRRDKADVVAAQPPVPSGLKPKDLCMMPARVALALQADKWYLRSDIIWAKPNPMPESATDRPASSYEHIFLLTKSAKYFWDAEAVKRPLKSTPEEYLAAGKSVRENHQYGEVAGRPLGDKSFRSVPSGANLRNVWTINTQPYPGAHFATFPEELPRRCILAGTSQKGSCAECGKPWVRVVEKKSTPRHELPPDNPEYRPRQYASGYDELKGPMRAYQESTTTGWQPSCKCKADTVPAVVLDPFFGSGTVGKVATDLGRNWLGIEISKDYIEQAKRRTAMRGLHEAV